MIRQRSGEDTMKRATLPHVVAWSVGLAILALLIYSLDRTAWLFQLYCDWPPGGGRR